ncbi:MAG: ribose 5-phosphate isomerase B [Ignavibacteria bacterium]|nr:ribose 5-phosphate isomerase B [Ignavibacteria bacterium]
MKISIGSDHAGYRHKEALKKALEEDGHAVIDVGTASEDSVDYPDFASAAARLVAEGKAEMGVLVCGTGIGVSIAANKIKGIRAANVTNVEMARLAREHNDANMVAVGARITPVALAIEIVRTFLKSEFSGGRHTKRVEKIQDLEQQ